MRHRIPTTCYATDPLSEAGIVSRLRPQPVIDLVAEDEIGKAVVGVVVADAVDADVIRVIRSIQHLGCTRVAIVVPDPDDTVILTLLEAGVCGILRRAEASSQQRWSRSSSRRRVARVRCLPICSGDSCTRSVNCSGRFSRRAA